MARSFPHPVSFHSLGGGKLRLPGRLQEAPRPWPGLRAGLRSRVGPACRSARGSQSRMRTCVETCVRLPRAACGPARAACRPVRGFAWPDSAAPTPLRPLRISSLADGRLRETERNLLGKPRSLQPPAPRFPGLPTLLRQRSLPGAGSSAGRLPGAGVSWRIDSAYRSLSPSDAPPSPSCPTELHPRPRPPTRRYDVPSKGPCRQPRQV